MKSRITKLAEPASLIEEPFIAEISASEIESDVALELENLRYLSRRTIPVREVGKGNIVTLEITPRDRKLFSDEIKLNVGLGLFDADFEKRLIGKSVPCSFSCGDFGSEHTVIIKQCFTVQIPEMNDETVRNSDETNALTVEEFMQERRAFFTRLYTDSYLTYYASSFAGELLEASDADIDERELEDFCEAWKKRQDEYNAFHDTSMYEEYSGQADEFCREEARSVFGLFLLKAALTDSDPEEIELSTESDALFAVQEAVYKPLSEILKPYFKVEWREVGEDAGINGE